jgi:hypothetical protein
MFLAEDVSLMAISPPRREYNIHRIIGAAALVVAALVILIACSPFMFQAFRGPRPISEQELLQMQSAGWFDNYVRFKPAAPVKDTEWVYGVEGNAGTKFLLLPVGDRHLLCSARIKNEGLEYVGSLGFLVAAEVETVVPADQRGKLLPFMLQAVRSIWFDTGAALLGIFACLAGTAWLGIQVAMTRGYLRNFQDWTSTQ